MAKWFDVDKEGLAAILERRGKAFALYELIQNAWDTDATSVTVMLEPIPSSPYVKFVVEDNSTAGYSNLSLAYTLFGRSTSAGDPEKRGRFCIGDKLVLALCRSASIRTMTGTVMFDRDGTRRTLRQSTDRGSRVSGEIRLTRAEYQEVIEGIHKLLPPITTRINGDLVHRVNPVRVIKESLPTEWADDEGILRKRTRETAIQIFEPMFGMSGTLYEMGIPVVETGDRYHVNICQKVPLNTDRDNVTPSYLRHVRTFVLNATSDLLVSEEEATAPWVRDASGDERIEPRALSKVMDLRFGERRVIADPSDPEGTKIAMSKGYTVVSGGSLSADEWERVRKHETMKPAGQVTPSPKPYSENGRHIPPIPEDQWSTLERSIVDYAKAAARHCLGVDISVELVKDRSWKFSATYGGCRLTLNLAMLGSGWWIDEHRIIKLLIHEFGHHYSSDHLSSRYHDALCEIGAKMTKFDWEL